MLLLVALTVPTWRDSLFEGLTKLAFWRIGESYAIKVSLGDRSDEGSSWSLKLPLCPSTRYDARLVKRLKRPENHMVGVAFPFPALNRSGCQPCLPTQRSGFANS